MSSSISSEFPVAGDGSALRREAAAAIDGSRDTVARGMESAASSIHERADSLRGGQRIADAAHSTASTVEAAADYVREHDVRGMLSDVGRIVRRNPGAALLIAAAAGVLIARSLARD